MNISPQHRHTSAPTTSRSTNLAATDADDDEPAPYGRRHSSWSTTRRAVDARRHAPQIMLTADTESGRHETHPLSVQTTPEQQRSAAYSADSPGRLSSERGSVTSSQLLTAESDSRRGSLAEIAAELLYKRHPPRSKLLTKGVEAESKM